MELLRSFECTLTGDKVNVWKMEDGTELAWPSSESLNK